MNDRRDDELPAPGAVPAPSSAPSGFRAATDEMLDIIDDLRATEDVKRRAPIGSPEFLAAARRSEELGRLAFRWAQMQLRMAHEIRERIAAGDVPGEVRLDTVAPRPLDQVLAQWREAQLRLEIAQPGSAEAEAAVRDIERLRDEYRAGHEARISASGGPRTVGVSVAGTSRGEVVTPPKAPAGGALRTIRAHDLRRVDVPPSDDRPLTPSRPRRGARR
jgi:hypothetical protein